jgi:hypothetical protein
MSAMAWLQQIGFQIGTLMLGVVSLVMKAATEGVRFPNARSLL